MRILKIAVVTVLLMAGSSCTSLHQSTSSTEANELRHVVAFRFKPDVTPEQMQKVAEDFRALKDKVPQIIEFEGGADLGYLQKNGEFTHVFIVTVENEEDLAAYGAHPDHQAFSRSVDPLLADVMVVDYWKE